MDISAGKSSLDSYEEFAAGFAFEDELAIRLNNGIKSRFQALCKSKAFEGKLLQVAQLQDGEKTAFVIGLGKRTEFDPEFLRRGAAAAYRLADGAKARMIELIVPEIKGKTEAELIQALVEGAKIASYKLETFKSEKKEDGRKVKVVLCGRNAKEVSEGISIGNIMGDAQNYVRALDENPSNIINPWTFSHEAKRLAKQYGMKIEILQRKELEKKGMNGIVSVGKGSVNQPMLISLVYDGGKSGFYSIIGKGITFDSGGISLKPSKGMQEMKYDKSGACVVLGVLKAAAELKLPIRILGMMPLAENKPSGMSSNPGDIIKMYNGKTVEINNTDAEGRLILGDALAYAAEKKPDAMIDIATLTGAMVVALGRHAIGLFSNDEKLVEKLKTAGQKTYERVWELPLWKEYSEMNKGDFADMKNVTDTGEAGSITAAAFLKEFVGETKWAHLDIAGVDNVVGKHPLIEKGATGTGVRLIVQSLIELSKKAGSIK